MAAFPFCFADEPFDDFQRDERVLVVWSDSIDTIVPTCHDFEDRLIKLLWRSRRQTSGSHATSLSSRPASVNGECLIHRLCPSVVTRPEYMRPLKGRHLLKVKCSAISGVLYYAGVPFDFQSVHSTTFTLRLLGTIPLSRFALNPPSTYLAFLTVAFALVFVSQQPTGIFPWRATSNHSPYFLSPVLTVHSRLPQSLSRATQPNT